MTNEHDSTASLPAAVAAHLDAGERHRAARNYAGAAQQLQAAAALAPDNETVLEKLGALAMEVRDWHAAERIHRHLDTRFPGRHRPRLALALFNQERYADALPLLASLVEHGNTDLSCAVAYAACLERTGNEDRAIVLHESIYQALRTSELATMLVSALVRLGRNELLDRRLPELIAAHPDNLQLQSALSEHALKSGDYARGFDLLHYRWSVSLEPSKALRLPCPDWDGKPFDGELLITAEQGLGEEILSSSMFEDLLRIGQRCHIECAARLLPVFRRSFPDITFSDRSGTALESAARDSNNRKIAALELGRVFRRKDSDFPARTAWLKPDPERSAALRAALVARHPGKRLAGISWRSARMLVGDAKTIPLEQLAVLLRLPDTVFIDLQYGDTGADREALRAATGLTLEPAPGIDATQDIDGLFALVDALDLVVSASNSTVHIAGSLGKPVYAMIPGTRFTLWYWGYKGETTPWYPGVRLLRGPTQKSWATLATELATALQPGNPQR